MQLPTSLKSTDVSSQLLAAGFMAASACMFTAYVVIGKYLSADYGPAMLTQYRSIIGLVCVLPFLIGAKPEDFKIKRPGLLLLRSLCGTLGLLLALFAISDEYGLPIAQFSAISFSRSLFVVILASIILRENVGPRRWIATEIGFLGVLVMVNPATDSATLLGSSLAIGSAVSLAMAIVLVKLLTQHHSAVALLLYASVLSTLLSIPIAIPDWKLPATLSDAGLILGLGVSGVLAQAFYILGMQKGDASFLSTIDYVRLPLTSAADWLIFRLATGPYIWIGAAMIIAATVFITIREAQLSSGKQRNSREKAPTLGK